MALIPSGTTPATNVLSENHHHAHQIKAYPKCYNYVHALTSLVSVCLGSRRRNREADSSELTLLFCPTRDKRQDENRIRGRVTLTRLCCVTTL